MHSAGRSSVRQAAALGYGRSSSATNARSRRSASAGSVASSRVAQYFALISSCRPDRLGSLATTFLNLWTLCRPPDYADKAGPPNCDGAEKVGIILTVSVERSMAPSTWRRLLTIVYRTASLTKLSVFESIGLAGASLIMPINSAEFELERL